MKLIFATNNQHKVEEIQSVINHKFEVVSLKGAGIHIDIPEPHDTLEANASEKSRTIHEMTQANCFSEDTGLEVESLGGEPGIKSARYSGENRSFDDNIKKLLEKLRDQSNRKARFRTVISLIWENKEYLFEGICPGKISEERQGKSGFGYDPIFIPDGSSSSFAEMTLAEKNQFSHRKKATDKLIAFLRQQQEF
ncbi:MAG: RdgB/HAM1 family non-canonical purine NTP pyrophosphatase [Bacteroidetes bacterium]|nr:RdgB/HAM1 family non-canonical purine NTP pyrophosphatase [Bacteroidota bacterium]